MIRKVLFVSLLFFGKVLLEHLSLFFSPYWRVSSIAVTWFPLFKWILDFRLTLLERLSFLVRKFVTIFKWQITVPRFLRYVSLRLVEWCPCYWLCLTNFQVRIACINASSLWWFWNTAWNFQVFSFLKLNFSLLRLGILGW